MRTFTTGTIQSEPPSRYTAVARFLRDGTPCPHLAGGELFAVERFLRRHANILTVRASGNSPDILASVGVFEDDPETDGAGELTPGKPAGLRVSFIGGLRVSSEAAGFEPDLTFRLMCEATLLVASPDDDGEEPAPRPTSVLAAVDPADARMRQRMVGLAARPLPDPPAWAKLAAAGCAAMPDPELWWLPPVSAARAAAWLADRHPTEVAKRVSATGLSSSLEIIDRTWRRNNPDLVSSLAAGSVPLYWVLPYERAISARGA